MMTDTTKRVMVVDDVQHIRELLSLILKNEGYDVIESVNGMDALAKLDGSSVDMLITDLNMPVMNGFELVKRLRNSDDFHSTPIIMVSSENHEAIRKKARRIGVNEWIIKPLIPSDLMDVVRRLIAKKDHLMRVYA
jgi:two-component system, chemotaxis family, chemotaxis protein CheY